MDAAAKCANCGAPLAEDQRYCLECGTRRAHLRAGPPTAAPEPFTGAAAASAGEATLIDRAASTGAPSAGPADGRPTTGPAGAPRSGGPTAVIAGVGVLLLAMGVGVLIGHAGANGKSSPPAQVISVATQSGAGAGAGSPTSTTSTTTSSTTTSSATTAKHGSGSSSTPTTPSSEVGQTPSKPAPPSVIPKTGGSGQSYEQKSKNIPNVVSTG